MKLAQLVITATWACDKACSMCCEDARPNAASMPFDAYGRLVEQLLELGVEKEQPLLGITGGEPLMYHDAGWRLADLVSCSRRLNPASFDIQTSGYGSRVLDLDEQMRACIRAADGIPLTVATSYSLTQSPGIDERMTRTIRTLLDVVEQEKLYVFLTSHRSNWKDTVRAFAKMCLEAGLVMSKCDVAHGAIEFERPPRKVTGVVSTTARVGRAKRLPEEAFAPARTRQRLEPCAWLASPDPTMNVLPNGGVKICCCPAYDQREPLINIFEEDAAEFFRIYPRVRQEICDEITKHAESGRFESTCEICNSLSLRAIAHEC
jgi:MoaA/NifB/PqqE/SkfB family radical SAM enzyme